MPLKPLSPSIFRPQGGVDQRVLTEHKALVEAIDRRRILRGALSLGALKVSGTDPIAVLADVNTTTDNGLNATSPTQTIARHQILSGDINGTVNAGVTVNGFGLNVSTPRATITSSGAT